MSGFWAGGLREDRDSILKEQLVMHGRIRTGKWGDERRAFAGQSNAEHWTESAGLRGDLESWAERSGDKLKKGWLSRLSLSADQLPGSAVDEYGESRGRVGVQILIADLPGHVFGGGWPVGWFIQEE